MTTEVRRDERVPTVSAVVLAWGQEPWLSTCVRALLASTGVTLDVVLVDNGCAIPGLVDELGALDRVRVLRPGRNLGFAGGCDAGAAVAAGDVLLFVNADAVVEPAAAAALARELRDPGVGLVCASLRLDRDPTLINSAGNPLHVLGLVWAGHLGEPAAAHATRSEVATVTGAAFAVRREVWRALGGFGSLHFAYHEDSDLSVRCWQRGWRVLYVPDAVVVHRYEFSRNPDKLFLLERNRLLNLLTLWQPRTLALLAPALVAFELAMVVVAVRGGWARSKLAGYWWLLRHCREVLGRRRAVQRARVVPDRELARLLTSRFDPASLELPATAAPLDAALAAYWSVVRRLL